jgi:hypothetical protein
MPQPKADMTYTDFFKARTELVKALADSARSYIQISSAALALPLLFSRTLLAERAAKSGSYAMGMPWSLVAACAFFLLAIVCGSSISGLLFGVFGTSFTEITSLPNTPQNGGSHSRRLCRSSNGWTGPGYTVAWSAVL